MSVVLAESTPVVFVVPAFDEEENLPRLFTDLEARRSLLPPGSRVIVVDDGSRDRTAEIAECYAGPLPVELVRLGKNSGPGAAFDAGFRAALAGSPGETLIVTLEADTTSDLDALPAMLELARTRADLVLASWVMVNVSLLRRVLSGGAAIIVRRVLGVEAHTVSSFFRVYRASCLRNARARYGSQLIQERGFACKAELLAKLTALGARVEDVPVALDTSRRIGASKMPIGRTVLAYWRLMARQRFHRAAT